MGGGGEGICTPAGVVVKASSELIHPPKLELDLTASERQLTGRCWFYYSPLLPYVVEISVKNLPKLKKPRIGSSPDRVSTFPAMSAFDTGLASFEQKECAASRVSCA